MTKILETIMVEHLCILLLGMIIWVIICLWLKCFKRKADKKYIGCISLKDSKCFWKFMDFLSHSYYLNLGCMKVYVFAYNWFWSYFCAWRFYIWNLCNSQISLLSQPLLALQTGWYISQCRQFSAKLFHLVQRNQIRLRNKVLIRSF